MLDIEERLTLDEKSGIDFLLSLRKRWADTIYPVMVQEHEASGKNPQTVAEAEEIAKDLPTYPWFSHIERAQQKLMWKTVGDAVVSRKGDLLEELEQFSQQESKKLQLNADIEFPTWYTDYDIHVQPGSFYTDDLNAYVYELGARIVMLRDNDGFKFHRLFMETALPNKELPLRAVDFGCGFGKNTKALAKRYPGAEIIGLDLAASGLKLAHAEAIAEGLDITYIQADARFTPLENNSCDIVTGTMLLHEMPSEEIVATIKEAHRILKPGGSLHFLEFMPTGDTFRDGTVYEHAERNNEPFFRELFATDLVGAAEALNMSDVKWTPFDERAKGVVPEGWGDRQEWHFPWAVFSATKN